MMLFPSLSLVATLLTFADVSSAQFYPPDPYLHPPVLPVFPPGEMKAPTNWVIPMLSDFNWNKLMHEANLKHQLDKVLAEVKNLTHNAAVSATKFQQIAMNHEDIYNLMHHFAEILRYHPDWKVMAQPYIQQHHLSPKYLDMFEQMMLFFLLHNFPGHHNVKTQLPPFLPPPPPPQPQPYYSPFDVMPYQPYFPPTNWMEGYGNSMFDAPYYGPMNEPNHPLSPLSNILLDMPPGFSPNMGFHYPPFPVSPWNNFHHNGPSSMKLGGNCAEMVNVTFQLTIYDEITCTTSIYAPRQSLHNFLAIAAQKNKCFKFRTERRSDPTSGKEGEYLISMNTIDATKVSKWSVVSQRIKDDPDLSTYMPMDGEVITLTFNLVGTSKNKRYNR